MAPAQLVRRCICGRSRSYPVCDGAHRGQEGLSEAWSCAPHAPQRPALCVAASAANHNLAERLAREAEGVTVDELEPGAEVERLVLLCEGHDLVELLPAIERVRARERVVWALCPAARAAAPLLGATRVVTIDDPGLALWPELQRALGGSLASTPPLSLAPAFLSHAVADEPLLLPAVERLRRLHGAELFVCADSIPPGAAWEEVILEALRARPRCVVLLSKALLASTSCAFEAGAARALGKRVVLVSLDGVRPPPFLGHLQAADLPRRIAARPWLTLERALVEALLEALLDEPVDAAVTSARSVPSQQ
jgi:hypothetical protein